MEFRVRQRIWSIVEVLREWKLPGDELHTYAVWVDSEDKVWLSEWGANAVVRFDPFSETFETFPSDRPNAEVRQMLGHKGEVWIAESGTERIRVIRYGHASKQVGATQKAWNTFCQ
jgi:virginiamycin B lyase